MRPQLDRKTLWKYLFWQSATKLPGIPLTSLLSSWQRYIAFWLSTHRFVIPNLFGRIVCTSHRSRLPQHVIGEPQESFCLVRLPSSEPVQAPPWLERQTWCHQPQCLQEWEGDHLTKSPECPWSSSIFHTTPHSCSSQPSPPWLPQRVNKSGSWSKRGSNKSIHAVLAQCRSCSHHQDLTTGGPGKKGKQRWPGWSGNPNCDVNWFGILFHYFQYVGWDSRSRWLMHQW